MVEGKILIDVTTAGDRLMLYRRERTQRFGADERAALYARLFDANFEQSFGAMLAALDAIARAPLNQNLSALIARAVSAARDVGLQLSQRSGGIALYAARSIADQVREALAVLRDPDLSRALGGGSAWQMMRMHAMQVLGRQLDPEPHLDRASAALRLTNWIAGAAAGIEGGAANLPPRDALDAAELWLASVGGNPAVPLGGQSPPSLPSLRPDYRPGRTVSGLERGQ
jgi:hypothetical protein